MARPRRSRRSLAEPAPSRARLICSVPLASADLTSRSASALLLALVEVLAGVDLGDLRVELRGPHVDQVLPLGDRLVEPRLHLGLLGQLAVGEHRLVLDLLLLGQRLEGLRIVVLADQHVRELEAVGGEALRQGDKSISSFLIRVHRDSNPWPTP